MRTQKVVVDIWKMVYSSCSYLVLAFFAWVFVKLFYACFWLPDYLKKQEDEKAAEKSRRNEDNKDEKADEKLERDEDAYAEARGADKAKDEKKND